MTEEEKIRAEIERRLKGLSDGCVGQRFAYKTLLSFIDFLQEEPTKFEVGDTIRPKGSKQQKMWRKEIEQAVLSGAYSGLNLARDERYEENKQKMPVSEDLEEAANKYEHSRVYESELENYSIYLENLEEGETPRMKEPSPDTKYLLNADIIEAFKAGSQWHKRQMMKDTVNVIVKSHPYFGLLIQVPDSFKCELGDEISIILNK